ncbi:MULTISPECIES: Asp-tRNA(Asn)/Glu-tRNA(Gln) amidotransferase subunit GatB [Curvivirga]|uniref:Asp-tRNA(Asn)/Glu-tRNA(Gln) amidotransferase subunit GatB n=1 Tax=Curvivirga TaxID=2856846 RepID=UPI0012BCAB0F|nr:Asp-tRNA(Asn)/Glu-tRNA(Gln) amidotransferase subunit GatB [Curvivirga aplysinae]MTI10305.1 Asp-tRNA(Asn)/Glu-tRNA(Gln) amidotransferase subunit GatB [Curvivirga aplysinae]
MTYMIKGNTGDWEVVMGLEIHAQVSSNAKLFSGAATTFGADPNEQVSLVDAAMPGMLPVVNKECVRQGVRTGLAMGCEINLKSVFARKNYFYADLPQGYQISQFEEPIVKRGKVTIDLEDGSTKEIGVERLHLEQDAGKSIHDQHPTQSYIDLNRSGVCLMEIVSDPDMRSPEEAAAYVSKIRSIVRCIGSCDGNMAEGSMRADVNVSVRKPGDEYGTRCEIKNLNSLRFMKQAIEFEAKRQVQILEEGGSIDQETRLFDTAKGITRSMRSKEDAHDYRYFPDPDLLPVILEQAWVDELAADLPELPDVKKNRFISDFGLPAYDAGVLTAETENSAYYEQAVDAGGDPKLTANWVISELFGRLNKADMSITDSPVTPENLGQLVGLIKDDTISGKIAKDVFDDMFSTGKMAKDIVEEKGLKQITDTGAIEAIIDDLIANNPGQVEQYRGGNEKLIGWFVGQTMKASQGKANPGVVNKILKEKLAG